MSSKIFISFSLITRRALFGNPAGKTPFKGLYGCDMEAFYRTAFHTGSAFCAFAVINGRAVVDDGNRLCGAVFLALHTAYAAVGTFLADDSAFLMVGAGHNGNLRQRNYAYYVLRAGFYAGTAGSAKLRVDMRNSVVKANCVVGADFGAVAAAETALYAGTGSAIEHFCGGAGFNRDAFFFCSVFAAVAAAMNKSDKRFCFFGFNTEYCGNFFCGFFTAGTAKVCGSSAFCKRFCIAVAAGKAAGSAVCTGKTFAYGNFLFVNLDVHKMGSKGKD